MILSLAHIKLIFDCVWIANVFFRYAYEIPWMRSIRQGVKTGAIFLNE